MNFNSIDDFFENHQSNKKQTETTSEIESIMIIDDDRDIRESLKILLGEKYNLIICSSGKEGIEKIHHGIFAVILDIKMKDKDGFDTFKELKLKEPYVPIIFHSAYQNLKDPYDVMNEYRPFGYIKKGDSNINLLDTIRSAVSFYKQILINENLVIKLNEFNYRLEEMVSERSNKLSDIFRKIREHTLNRENMDTSIKNREINSLLTDFKLESTKEVTSENANPEFIKSFIRQKSELSSDMYLVEFTPSGILNIFIGNFTGDEFASAIGAMPVADIFRIMTRKGFSQKEILNSINKKISTLLADGTALNAQFVAINFRFNIITACNLNMPDIFILNSDNSIKIKIPAENISLGTGYNNDFSDKCRQFQITDSDKIILSNSGIYNSKNASGELFGNDRLMDILTDSEKSDHAEAVRNKITEFCSTNIDKNDIIFIEINYSLNLFRSTSLPPDIEDNNALIIYKNISGYDWEYNLVLKPGAFKKLDPVPMIINHLNDFEILDSERKELFTVFQELYNNALEHGILNLDSSLKSNTDGFMKYFEQKEKLLASAHEGEIRIQIRGGSTGDNGELFIRIEDTGTGFDYEKYLKSAESNTSDFYGRGINLIKHICRILNYDKPGNKAEVFYTWEKNKKK